MIFQTDFYKVDHAAQYPPGTTAVYSNFTPRASRVPGQNKVVLFGLQYFLRRWLMEDAQLNFFNRDKELIVAEYQEMLDAGLGPNNVDVKRIGALHDLGYIPLKFWALPEGTHVPLRVPMFTFQNTHPEFFWVTNYIETLLSSVLRLPCTSATTAYRYRKLLDAAAVRTGGPTGFVPWQGHDFSFRGMGSPEAAALSGAGHLLSFTGTDTIPAIRLLKRYYGAIGLVGGSVPATEHSVMCAGGMGDECATFERLLDLYPSGNVSVVSDTWNLWDVLDLHLPRLKDKIMARPGKLVIRPDSGDPVKIICGDDASGYTSPRKGVIERLWEIFGGTVNEAGFKELDSHIGAIYGDSITEERARQITERLEAKGFASTNVVFGIGSYTYQYVTRDTFGFAVKATWARVNGKERAIFKNPKTDDGTKKSLRGKIAVVVGDDGLEAVDGLTDTGLDTDLFGDGDGSGLGNLLQPVWQDGQFIGKTQTLEEIRERVLRG